MQKMVKASKKPHDQRLARELREVDRPGRATGAAVLVGEAEEEAEDKKRQRRGR